MYPSKLIDYANSVVPDFINIQVSDIGIAFAVLPGIMKFTLSAIVAGSAPTFSCQWMKPGVGTLRVRCGGNVATTLTQLRIWSSLGTEIYKNTNLNLSIGKGGFSSPIYIGAGVDVAIYYVRAFFQSEYGQYAREYQFIYDTATYNTWFNCSQFGAIN